ncbi:hypothetical protein HCH_01622 [Hahella chejuensis KCTC 2396]|uniref:Uncharacterized protein n=1 Tax=Hahella chejuensis (strain KCTC 2396) TaxID=349521 RepID=Q2SLJ6_HAHCH|nr:hypothetical protein HCH_01622 [Hahella chejuensis KCTC 2396]
MKNRIFTRPLECFRITFLLGKAPAFYRLQPADGGVKVTCGFGAEHGLNLFSCY